MPLGVLERWRCFWSRLPVGYRGSLIASIPIACLFAALGTFGILLADAVEDEAWVRHTEQVRLETKLLLQMLLDAETGARGYNMTGREPFLEPYERARRRIPAALDRLENLVEDNPSQTAALHAIRRDIDRNLVILSRKVMWRRNSIPDKPPYTPASMAQLYDWLEAGRAAMDATRDRIEAFAREEERLLAERRAHMEGHRTWTAIVLLILAIAGTASAVLVIQLFRAMDRELTMRQQQLQKANTELAQAYNRLQQFTADASHELRAPLSAILSNAQVALLAPTDDLESPRQRLRKIADQAKAMSRLIGHLLMLARAIAQPEMHQRLDLRRLLAEVRADSADLAAARGLTLILVEPPPVCITGNADLLRQALLNLTHNACQYTPSGGTIHLSLAIAGDRVCIQVSDTGSGIPAADLPHIFERFYRVDRARSRQTGGSGLGLAIAQQIATWHGGKITANSVEGDGSTFTLDLPQSP
ncbi:MAG: histidine kinase [Coleofasciculaceae cyanobacterium SM2_3_26]|nr:histidine kinase [Coleofasciculaceae cyanobacterium SM2_3_26]